MSKIFLPVPSIVTDETDRLSTVGDTVCRLTDCAEDVVVGLGVIRLSVRITGVMIT